MSAVERDPKCAEKEAERDKRDKANAIAKSDEKERKKEKALNDKIEHDKAIAITKVEEKEKEKERRWEQQYTGLKDVWSGDAC